MYIGWLPLDIPCSSKILFLFLDAIVKAAFLKKCKEAGLLDALFEEILDKLHLIQERLMDETTAESGTEITKFLHVSQTYIMNKTTTTLKYTFSFYAVSFFFSFFISFFNKVY